MQDNEKVEVSDDEFRIAVEEPHLDGALLPKIVLAIIRANPDPGSTKSDSKRLNAAMKAILGSRYNARKSSPNTSKALRWMAEEFVKDRGGPGITPGPDPFRWLSANPKSARTVKDLAKEAYELYAHATSPRHLENLFSEYGETLCKTVVFTSEIPGSLHMQAIDQVRKILTPLGINMKLEDVV